MIEILNNEPNGYRPQSTSDYHVETFYLDEKSINALSAVQLKTVEPGTVREFYLWYFNVYFNGNSRSLYYLKKNDAEYWQKFCLGELMVNSPDSPD
jgi:hypothetical protein